VLVFLWLKPKIEEWQWSHACAVVTRGTTAVFTSCCC
jgi:hypothetical protein